MKKVVTYLALYGLFTDKVKAEFAIQDLEDFNYCLDRGLIACRSLWNDREAVCCLNDAEIDNKICIQELDENYCALSYN